MKKSALVLFGLGILFALSTSALASDNMKALIDQRCTMCHTSERIYNAPPKSLDQWRETVLMMVVNGAALDNAQMESVAQYLYSLQNK
ncbi:hypothetical protein LGV61_07675 [Desulfurispirillum indicum]|uniref:Quinohemoprotein amine dehydrogenase alpha subunit haem binding domain-containing protein n=1 Tax=Desulfurispirillum indicum (strain ATCC BAA-1389 / DSM 22839 / S5) TaxID=653733 RepID=E6W7B1_DESIS|nr:hypothetical protein [Desulfurispirillum indicum]ADU66278.1 hypothetical protein Selin_1545 [Desulfurispirillum indicum S5]UCZ55609.1 hypothetical protein LGV61_07675 [Desulfurispirillum indicum]